MLYCDQRIAGVERWYAYLPDHAGMIVPPEIRKCVVYLGRRDAKGISHLAGTAFILCKFVRRETAYLYLVTAAHVIKQLRLAPSMFVRLNLRDKGTKEIEIKADDWIFHESDSTVDVAILRMPGDLLDGCDHLAFPLYQLADKSKRLMIEPGLEVFLTGLFVRHQGRERNIPIVRVGTIAANPEEKVKTRLGEMDAYLVEVRSTGGLSGSPVYVEIKGLKSGDGKIIPLDPSLLQLLGVVHGHWDEELAAIDSIPSEDLPMLKRINMGIAIVSPAEKIFEVLMQSKIIDAENAELELIDKAQLPTMDMGTPDEAPFTQTDFENALKKVAKKRIKQPE